MSSNSDTNNKVATIYPGAGAPVSVSPEILMSKLIRDNKTGKNKKNKDVSLRSLNSAHKSLSSNLENIDNIFQLFPDIELAVQILVSSILSPKTLNNVDLLYSLESKLIPSELVGEILILIKDRMKEYNIVGKLPEILRQSLFTKGAYITAILPESTVDKIINTGSSVSTESMKVEFDDFNIGIISKETKTNNSAISLEATDNYNLLKKPIAVRRNRDLDIERRIDSASLTGQVSLEDDADEFTSFFKEDTKEHIPSIVVSDVEEERGSFGKPLILKLPYESVIPIHVPGDPSDHMGYFILVDGNGNPLTSDSKIDLPTEGLDGLMNASNNKMIKKAKDNLVGVNRHTPELPELVSIYTKIVEDDLKKTLEDSNIEGDISEIDNNNLYRVMLSRSLANHKTTFLYIPSSLVSYFAYKYNKNGTGKSLMSDLTVIASMRAMLLLATVEASIKGAIPNTEITVKLDDSDPDPSKSLEKVISEILLTREQASPYGVMNTADLVSWSQRAGLSFSIQEHPGLPNIELTYEERKLEITPPDESVDKMLSKRMIMAFGLTPELIEDAQGPDFATAITSNRLMLSKRVKQIQDIYTPQISRHIQVISRNDYGLRDSIKTVLEDNYKDIEKHCNKSFGKKLDSSKKDGYLNWITKNLVKNVQVNLPSPETSTLEVLKEAYEEYKDSLETALEAWVSEEIVSDEFSGRVSEYIEPMKEMILGHYLRKWQAENNFMPELNDLSMLDSDGKAMLSISDMNSSHLETLVNNATSFIKNSVKLKKKSNKTIDKAEEALDAEDEEDLVDDTSDTDIDIDENKVPEGEGLNDLEE